MSGGFWDLRLELVIRLMIDVYGSLAEFVGKRAVEKAASWKSPKGRTFPLRLRILQQRQDFHFSHRPDDGCTFQFPLGTKNS